ncbi:unnamed protein product, partial [Allacma fusca]
RDIEVHDTCNIQPKDDKLTFGESIWLAYDCNVRMALNSTPLTLKSYVTLMSGLPFSRQADIWDKIPVIESVSASDNDEAQKASTIKSYWQSYFGAVRQVCLTTRTVDQVGSVTLKPNVLQNRGTAKKHTIDILEPSTKCQEGLPVPRNIISAYFEPHVRTNRSDYKTCWDKMKDASGNVTGRSIWMKTQIFCSLAPGSSINLDDLLKTNPDIDHIVESMLPKFLSKSAKAVAIEKTQELLLNKSGTNTTSLQELLQWHQTNLPNKTSLRKGTEFNKGDIFAAGIFFGHLFKVYDTVKFQMCTGFESTKKP